MNQLNNSKAFLDALEVFTDPSARTEPFRDLEDLAQFLENLPPASAPEAKGMARGFDMSREGFHEKTFHPCGTAACIGGWVVALNHAFGGCIRIAKAVHSLAPQTDYDACYSLCFPDERAGAYNATPQKAAQAVRNLAAGASDPWEGVL